jgi:hypothetical protein
MSIPAIYTGVINGLLHKSQLKEVIWDVTTNADVFVVYFENSSLTLHQHYDQNGSWIDVDVIDYKGDKIDGFVVLDNEGIDWDVVNELFSIARRSALAIDTTIQGIIFELNKKGIVGQRKEKDGTDDIPF